MCVCVCVSGWLSVTVFSASTCNKTKKIDTNRFLAIMTWFVSHSHNA